jgi:hypothetical protein
MGSLKSFVPRLAGLSGTVLVAGRLGVLLVLGLIILLAVTGVFGRDRYRDAAQAVLVILLGRKNKAR